MTTTVLETEGFWGVDSFDAYAFPLNSGTGAPLQSGAIYAGSEPFEGYKIDGLRNFNITPAEGTVVANIGNGRLRDTIYRAPREPSRAELTIGYTQPQLKAKLQGTNTYTIGEMLLNGRLTNKQGSEPDIAFLITQRGHNDNGLTRYRTYFVPKSRIIPRDSSFNDNASEETFGITLSNSKKQIWGGAFVVATHGFTDATYEEAVSEGEPKIVVWLADGVEDVFNLPEDFPALSVGKFTVWDFIAGTKYTSGISLAVDSVDFAAAPANGKVLVGLYEFEP